MTLATQIRASIDARRTTRRGLSTELEVAPFDFGVDTSDLTKSWSDQRTFPAGGFDEVDFATLDIAAVKVLVVRNLSAASAIGLSAGWNGSQFANFRADATAWNFSPMVNLGSLTLRGYPILPGGFVILGCPNTSGLATTAGGSILRVGGVPGQKYEIKVMGN